MNRSCYRVRIISFVALFLLVSMLTGCDDPAELSPTPEQQSGPGFTLYGKTLDNENFDWESLRGKYVLVKFTATWCSPCQRAIPGMRETYEKYHDKGFEIVSVYIGEGETDPVSTVRRFVERERLPWIIISEALTEQAGQPPQGQAFGIRGVPTMVLVDKEGEIITIDADYKAELRKIFGE